MYLGIDIGGTKTLVAQLDANGVIVSKVKFATPRRYDVFLKELAVVVDKLATEPPVACCVAVPGLLDRKQGIAKAFGNLDWRNVPIRHDIHQITGCPTVIENDANLAGLSEAMLIKQYNRVFYITISTGVGGGYIVNRTIDLGLEDSEPGYLLLTYHNKLQRWQDFASGRAIFQRFGKRVADIHDAATLKIIAHAIALGVVEIIATFQPEVIVFGGGADSYFERFEPYLKAELKRYETPMTPLPHLIKAGRPEEAVVFGCYDQAKHVYG